MKKDTFIYRDEEYALLMKQGDRIFNPSVFGSGFPVPGKKGTECSGTYRLDGYQLMLDGLLLRTQAVCPAIREVEPVLTVIEEEPGYVSYEGIGERVAYTGGIVIGRDFVYDFGLTGEYPCFCYRKVVELLFQNGKLVTSIDHQKAMVRIRKNLKLGLRDLKKGKDARCIRRFLKQSLVGRYSDSFLKKSMKLAKRKVKALGSGAAKKKDRADSPEETAP